MILHLRRLLAGLAIVSQVVAGDEQGGAATPTSVEQQVLDFEQSWIDAEMRRNGPALREILDARFVATFGTGKPSDKDRFMRRASRSRAG